jgi:DNA-binding NarL/FixJ family response regulator
MKILALSNYDELAYIQDMMDAGAKGYVKKY